MTTVDRANGGAPSRVVVLTAFAAIYLIWGSTYLAIKYAIATVPPFFMTGVRFLIAGSVLFAWAALRDPREDVPPDVRHRRLTARRRWRDAFIVGALLIVGGTALVGWAELTVPSGITSLILATTPLWMVTLDSAVEARRLPSARVVAGVLVGLAGLAILVGPSLLAPDGQLDLLGVGALVLASLAWSAGAMYSRRAAVPASPARATGMQMIAGGLLSVIGGFAMAEHRQLSLAAISPASLLAVGYLVIAGALVGFTAYLWLMRVSTPSRVATHAYVNPVVAVMLGFIVLGEPITARTIAAMAVILLSVIVIVSAPKDARPARARSMLSFRHGELAERRS